MLRRAVGAEEFVAVRNGELRKPQLPKEQ